MGLSMSDNRGLKERNWAGNYDYLATDFQRPESMSELRNLIAGTQKIRALGSRHSFSSLADSSGTLVSLAGIGPQIEIDEQTFTVRVAGGVTYGHLANELSRAGFALHNMASLPHISVAGAIATGTHGSGIRNGNLATAVQALTIIDAQGDLREVSRGNSAEFTGYVIGLGALGVVVDVTLRIERSYDMVQSVYTMPSWEAVVEDVEAILSSAYSVSIFTRWDAGSRSQLWLKARLDGPDKHASVCQEHDALLSLKQLHPIPGGNGAHCTEQLGVPGAWNNRLPHFRMDFVPSNGEEIQSEYLVPVEHAQAALRAITELSPVITPLLQISEIRAVAGDDLWMSPSYAQTSVALHFTWVRDSAAVDEVLPHIEAALLPLGARPHWGKQFLAPAAALSTLYPRFEEFKQLVVATDPEGKFGNDFLAHKIFG